MDESVSHEFPPRLCHGRVHSVCVGTWVCVWWIWVLSVLLHCLFLRQGLPLNLELTRQSEPLSCRLQVSSCLCLPSTRISGLCHHSPGFYVGAEDQRSYLHTHVASTLLTEPQGFS